MTVEPHNTFHVSFHQRLDFDFKEVEVATCLIIDEALQRGIHAEFVLGKYLVLSHDGEKKLFHITDNSSLSYLAQKISASKIETKTFLQREGIHVPHGKRFSADNLGEIVEFAEAIPDSVVIKPDSGSEGKGVYCDVNKASIPQVVAEIQKSYRYLVVEEQIQGNEYRVFATREGYISVVMRRPASVLGDGYHSLLELIDEKNADRQPKNTKPRTCPFIKIEIDDVVRRYLESHHMSLAYVPAQEQRVYLRGNSNVSTGGDAIEMTDSVHPSVREIALRALKAIPGMAYAGIDFMTPDITQDVSNTYAILELNNMPGITSFHYPYIGKPQNVAGALINLVFPDTKR